MINPIAGYGARGAIWYQGESNAGNGDTYGELLAALVKNWRQHWGEDFSFYYVQLANFKKPSTEPGQESGWIMVQDEMRRLLQTEKHVGMAVINDIGEENDIHPRNKKDVGSRLARWALNQDYGKTDVVPSGPLYSGFGIIDGKIIIKFDHAKGLKSRDGGELKRFEIAGEDGKWHWANAKIQGENVVVSSPEVPAPAAARYAWAENPTGANRGLDPGFRGAGYAWAENPTGANLVNAEDLPTSVFTTK